MFERIKRNISNKIIEKVDSTKKDMLEKSGNFVKSIKSKILEETPLGKISNFIEKKQTEAINNLSIEINDKILKELQYRFKSNIKYQNPEISIFAERSNKRKRDAQIQIELLKESGLNLTSKILKNAIKKHNINILFITDKQVDFLKNIILNKLPMHQIAYERKIELNKEKEKFDKLQEKINQEKEEQLKKEEIEKYNEEIAQQKKMQQEKIYKKLMEQEILKLRNVIIILDSNIYMKKEYERIFNFFIYKNINTVLMTSQQYDEIANKVGFESRQAKRIIDNLSKLKLLIIHNITISSNKNAYADIELIKYIREFCSKNHNILFITDDKDLSIRTIQITREDGTHNFLEVLSGMELDFKLSNYYYLV